MAPTGAQDVKMSCVRHLIQLRVLRASKKEYLKGDEKGKQAGKQAGNQESDQAGKQESNQAGKHLGGIQLEPCHGGACYLV